VVDVPNQSTGPSRAEQLATLARERFEPMSDHQHAAGFEAAVARVEPRASAATRRRMVWATSLLAAAAVFALVVRTGLQHRQPPALSYRVEGAELQKERYVRASVGTRPLLRFSDGTVVALEERTSLRIASVDARGAHFAVENGQVRADVIHTSAGAWMFDAGPFAVEVTGTTFTLAWGALDGRLDVRLEKGLLRIHTPFSREPIALHGDQKLVATSSKEQVIISSLHDDDSAGETGHEPAPAKAVVGSAAAPATPMAEVTRKPVASARASAPVPWAESFRAGDFKAILDDAREHGLDATMTERGVEDLSLLADAARYAGQTAIARRALLAQRARFDDSSRAKDAAFLLGRMQEPSDPEGALVWYDRYLAEVRGGTYASEALGRKMLVVQRLRGIAAARPIAMQYLERFAGGPHASSAKAITGEP
jgi:hypothetical protein